MNQTAFTSAPPHLHGEISAQHIRLVQQSFSDVEPIAQQAGEMFYRRLFELDPTLRSLFHHSPEEQAAKLMQTLKVVVAGLTWPARLLPSVRLLGAKHRQYGVELHHYSTVGEALMWTLQQGLGSKFTPETRHAWELAYEFLAHVMQDGMGEGIA